MTYCDKSILAPQCSDLECRHCYPKKSFPCWVCRGRGSWVEPVTDEGYGPYESCSYCEAKGLIEVGGKRHREIVAEGIAMKILRFTKPPKNEWTWDELQALGNAALKLAEL